MKEHVEDNEETSFTNNKMIFVLKNIHKIQWKIKKELSIKSENKSSNSKDIIKSNKEFIKLKKILFPF